MNGPIHTTIRDRETWTDLRELDNHGEGLTQWEIDFVDDLTRRLLGGAVATEAQREKLKQIMEDRL